MSLSILRVAGKKTIDKFNIAISPKMFFAHGNFYINHNICIVFTSKILLMADFLISYRDTF